MKQGPAGQQLLVRRSSQPAGKMDNTCEGQAWFNARATVLPGKRACCCCMLRRRCSGP